MKHPLESLLTAGGILLLALLSCLLLPAPSPGLVLAQKLVTTFHMVDLNQLYTICSACGFYCLGLSNSCCVSSGVAGFHWRRKP
jgi:hypothetical protein